MSKICYICDKRPSVGNLVSNANNKVKRWIYPNTQKLRFTVSGDAKKKVIRNSVCTKCIKAGKVVKVI